MDYFLDFEFVEDGCTIDPISVAIISGDGREYYAQFENYDYGNARMNSFVVTNVIPQLTNCESGSKEWHMNKLCLKKKCPWRSTGQVVREILDFIGDDPEIKLFTWYGAYDHVAFCQLFGKMIDLPEGYPQYTRDIKYLYDLVSEFQGEILLPPEQKTGEHHALADARWTKQAYEYLLNYVKKNLEHVKERVKRA